MKKYQIVVSIILILILATSVLGNSYDFRKTRWGMNREDVIKSEKEPPVSESVNIEGFDNIIFLDNLVGKSVGIIYYFVQNQLFIAKYHLMTKHSNKNDFLDDFNDFKQGLIKKYGKPKKEETNWKRDLLKDKHEYWGMAIADGDLEKRVFWETETTLVILQLIGENSEISCTIRYEAKDPELLRLKEEHYDQQTERDL